MILVNVSLPQHIILVTPEPLGHQKRTQVMQKELHTPPVIITQDPGIISLSPAESLKKAVEQTETHQYKTLASY